MKTKNFLRALFVAVFVLGVMAMNAQSKFYIPLKNGPTKVYNMSDVERISFIAVGPNLLNNPGFELPATGAENVLPTDWNFVTDTWSTSYYGSSKGSNPITSGNSRGYRLGTPTSWFDNGQFGYGFVSLILAQDYTARIGAGNAGGLYQDVTVIAGATYEYGCKIGFRLVNKDDNFYVTQPLKILYGAGFVNLLNSDLILNVTNAQAPPEGGGTGLLNYKLFPNVKGQVTIPAGITTVRFQVDQRTAVQGWSPAASPVMAWDECFFRKIGE